MNLRKLETFYWAAKLGSFTAAAERLCSTPSTVSMRIQELEREYSTVLFDRSQRRARVTVVGRELVQHVEELLRVYARITEQMTSAETMPGTLRMGVAEVVSITWLPELVGRIHDRYPRIRVELEEALTGELIQGLEQGRLDLVLAPGRVPGYGLGAIDLGGVQFEWMASPSLDLPAGTLSPEVLQNWPVIALARESFHHPTIQDWFRSGGASCRQIDTCKSMGVAASLAASGLGIALLPSLCFRDELETGRLRVLQAEPAFEPIGFTATCDIDTFSPLSRCVAEMARETSTFELAGEAPAVAEPLAG